MNLQDAEFPVDIMGNKIRQLRKIRGLTVEELAEKAGLSQGMISQLERGQTKPSLDTLWKLSLLLEVPLFAFFEDLQKEPVLITRREEQKIISIPGSNVQYRLLVPSTGRKLEFFEMLVEPGQEKNLRLFNHQGEESGILLQGILEITIIDKNYLLAPGDSIYFDSSLPHRFYNPGEETVVAIWAMTPPRELGQSEFS